MILVHLAFCSIVCFDIMLVFDNAFILLNFVDDSLANTFVLLSEEITLPHKFACALVTQTKTYSKFENLY